MEIKKINKNKYLFICNDFCAEYIARTHQLKIEYKNETGYNIGEKSIPLTVFSESRKNFKLGTAYIDLDIIFTDGTNYYPPADFNAFWYSEEINFIIKNLISLIKGFKTNTSFINGTDFKYDVAIVNARYYPVLFFKNKRGVYFNSPYANFRPKNFISPKKCYWTSNNKLAYRDYVFTFPNLYKYPMPSKYNQHTDNYYCEGVEWISSGKYIKFLYKGFIGKVLLKDLKLNEKFCIALPANIPYWIRYPIEKFKKVSKEFINYTIKELEQ